MKEKVIIRTMERPTTVSREAVRAAILEVYAEELAEKREKRKLAKKPKKA